jgi:hypothetical protein
VGTVRLDLIQSLGRLPLQVAALGFITAAAVVVDLVAALATEHMAAVLALAAKAPTVALQPAQAVRDLPVVVVAGQVKPEQVSTQAMTAARVATGFPPPSAARQSPMQVVAVAARMAQLLLAGQAAVARLSTNLTAAMELSTLAVAVVGQEPTARRLVAAAVREL